MHDYSTHVINLCPCLTLTFISRSYFGEKPLKIANSLKIFFSRTFSARGEQKAV
jgi:hypothetical protein